MARVRVCWPHIVAFTRRQHHGGSSAPAANILRNKMFSSLCEPLPFCKVSMVFALYGLSRRLPLTHTHTHKRLIPIDSAIDALHVIRSKLLLLYPDYYTLHNTGCYLFISLNSTVFACVRGCVCVCVPVLYLHRYIWRLWGYYLYTRYAND